MGANLCCFKRSRSEQAAEVTSSRSYQIIPHQDTNRRDQKSQEDEVYKVEYSTLKEFLLASPAMSQVPSSLEANAFYTPRVSLSSPDEQVVNAGYFSPRLSFSSERLEKIEEIDEKKLSTSKSAMISKSQSSGKFKKKRVTFKLPEKGDVIMFYSPQRQV